MKNHAFSLKGRYALCSCGLWKATSTDTKLDKMVLRQEHVRHLREAIVDIPVALGGSQ